MSLRFIQKFSPYRHLRWTNNIVAQNNFFHISAIKLTEERKPEINKETWGHKDGPVIVASHYKKCIVGCRCHDNAPTIKWFFLEEGPSQVCDCGIYFQLEKVKKDTWIPEHARIMSVDDGIPDPRVERRGLPFIYPKKNEEPVKLS